MQVAAKLRFARISAQKARLVGQQIKGLPVDNALNILTFSPKKGAQLVKKVLESAIANEGPTHKRMQARAKGRGTRILKRTSHITIAVADK